jgi:aspartate/methionine/tyrosine aminotransferase
MNYQRMPIEVESPEELGYSTIRYNLAESSVRDIHFKDLNIDLGDLMLSYGEHSGSLVLREEIVKDEPLDADHVLVCPGAATALFIISTALLQKEDHVIVMRPNYATNIETPRAIGCSISFVELTFENNFQFSIDEVREKLRSNTRLISVTSPHNPTGVVFNHRLMLDLITLAEERNIQLLVDETYRNLNFQSALQSYYAAHSPNVLSVCSLSKAFGVPGIRTGWILTRNKKLMHRFLAAKEQIIICNSIVDEAIARHVLAERDVFLQRAHTSIAANFRIVKDHIAGSSLEWIEPDAGVVCFPRIKKEVLLDLNKFYRILYDKYKTVAGPGHWFEQPDCHMRIGFGYPSAEELKSGLDNIEAAIREAAI